MHSVYCCSLPVWRKSFLKKGTPRDLFWPRPGSAPEGIWPKNNNTCKGPWVLHPYQVSSKSIERFWRRSWKCESLRTTTDGRTTDDGWCAMTIAHLSLRLRWANKRKWKCRKLKKKNLLTLQIKRKQGSPKISRKCVKVSFKLKQVFGGGSISGKDAKPNIKVKKRVYLDTM